MDAPRSSDIRFPLRSVLQLGFVLALIGGAGLGLWQLLRPRAELAVAITSWPGYEYFYLAEQKQLAHRFGLHLRVQQYGSLQDQRQAFERGDVPVMATTPPEAIAVCQDTPGRCPLLVLVLDQSNGADRLIARAPLQRPQELLGRRVGLEPAVLADYLLLRSFGDRPPDLARDLTLHRDGPEALVHALKRAEVDAIVTYSPHDRSLNGDPRFRELFSSRNIPGEVVDVLAVDPNLARRHPDQVEALVRTWWAARDFARRFPTEARTLMAQRQQMDASAFAASEQGVSYPTPAQQRPLLEADGPVARALRRMAGVMLASDRIRRDAPLPTLTTRFLVDP